MFCFIHFLGQNPVNPFKTVNPFQAQQQQQLQQQQQNYQNWTIPEQPQNNNNNNNNFMTNGFGSPLQNNGFTNGFYYNSNMTNGNIMQASPFGVNKAAFGNPFMVSVFHFIFVHNPFININFNLRPAVVQQIPTIHFYEETLKLQEFNKSLIFLTFL